MRTGISILFHKIRRSELYRKEVHALEQCGYLANKSRIQSMRDAEHIVRMAKTWQHLKLRGRGMFNVSDCLKHWYDQIQPPVARPPRPPKKHTFVQCLDVTKWIRLPIHISECNLRSSHQFLSYGSDSRKQKRRHSDTKGMNKKGGEWGSRKMFAGQDPQLSATWETWRRPSVMAYYCPIEAKAK